MYFLDNTFNFCLSNVFKMPPKNVSVSPDFTPFLFSFFKIVDVNLTQMHSKDLTQC